MALEFLVPYPRKLTLRKTTFARPKRMRVNAGDGCGAVAKSLASDLRGLAGLTVSRAAPFAIELRLKERSARREGYRLALGQGGAEVTAADEPGLFYGVQTLLQILVLGDPAALPTVRIIDWPEYRTRSFMVDLGRSIFQPVLLRRIVRILARLKMNTLHLHLNDDELNGLRFDRLPLGTENPEAITLADLADLVRYARRFHVTVLPEIECWGHAASFLYHFPELHGGPGMWGGMSFGIGEPLFDFFEAVFDELVPVLETDCPVHVGLDEATWATLPGVPKSKRRDYTPTKLVERLYDLLERVGDRHGRQITMHLWADHGGRPIPARLRRRVVVEPWMYWEFRERDIRAKLRRWGGRGKPRLMMGAGMSSGHFGGHFGATRVWCQGAVGLPNVEGVTVCLWEDNDLPEKMIGLYGGADYAWSPESPEREAKDVVNEMLHMRLGVRMRKWQAAFKDADDASIRADRGPHVYRGLYCWGDRAGQPVAPTVLFKVCSEDDTEGAMLG